MHANCQNDVYQELIWALSWNFWRMLKAEDDLTKRQHVHTIANATVTAAFTTATTSVDTTCNCIDTTIDTL